MRRDLCINSVKDDMANGVLLIQLVEILCDDKIEKYNKRPMLLVHCIENITIAMDFLKKHGFDISFVAPAGTQIPADYYVANTVYIHAEIAKGEPKSVLGLFWHLIAHFQLSDLRNKWKDKDTYVSRATAAVS